MPTTVAFLPPVFVPHVTAASSSVSLSLCCRPSASLRSPSGSPFEPSKPRLPIIVACTAAPFNEFEAKVRAQKQLCKVAEFSESTCLGVEETIHCDGALNVGKDECAEVVENTWIQFQPLVSVPWDSLACLLFWCMLLGHHLRGLEYLLELMQLFRESVKVETISQEGDNDARELQTTLIFSVGRRRLFDEPNVFVGFSQRLVSPSTRQLESCPSVNACLPA
ncbi:uncharacterized protein LOC135586842 [Musa acuminata AAA Group]|uniref:uncharacterized protein LOC135586842 n=1 Tax=Musa acuminata AAA Group TaxID=214697 RepID=UPI0031DC753F